MTSTSDRENVGTRRHVGQRAALLTYAYPWTGNSSRPPLGEIDRAARLCHSAREERSTEGCHMYAGSITRDTGRQRATSQGVSAKSLEARSAKPKTEATTTPKLVRRLPLPLALSGRRGSAPLLHALLFGKPRRTRRSLPRVGST